MIRNGLTYNIIQAEQMASEGKIKAFALFIILKSKYRNGCFQDWSIKSISEKTGFSRQYLTKHIKTFIKEGWAVEHCGNLMMRSFKSFDQNKQKEFSKIHINESDGVKDVVSAIRLDIIKNKDKKFQYLKRVKADNLKPQNSKVLKRVKKALKTLELKNLPDAGDNYTVSISKISKMFGCSPATACKEMQRFKKNGDVQCISGYREHKGAFNNPAMIRAALSVIPGSFLIDGILYVIECNQYIF